MIILRKKVKNMHLTCDQKVQGPTVIAPVTLCPEEL
jgi:hypothetical protein